MYNPPDAAAPRTSRPRDAGFPLLEVRDLGKKYNSSRESIVAIESVSVNLAQGEFLSIVGPSGCGKSTLLKILSRITEPTLGCAKLYGRVGSLLEVGTGFHPDLTGRENIYLNGTILGIKRSEIKRHFEFARGSVFVSQDQDRK